MKLKTKFILTYVAGIVTGCVLLFVFFFIVGTINSSSANDDVVMFEKPRNIVPGKSFKIIQVFPNGNALASGDDLDNLGLAVLVTGDESTSYYDGQIIKIPEGNVVRQIGNYSYIARNRIDKTVPIVNIIKI